MAARSDIRQFINGLGPSLERAQAQGTLARTRLDVRDQFTASIADEDEESKAASVLTFNEELDAFCVDMRFASVTVQQQVERHTRRWGRGFLFGTIGATVVGLWGLGLAVSGRDTVGVMGVFLIIFGCPTIFVALLVTSSSPSEPS